MKLNIQQKALLFIGSAGLLTCLCLGGLLLAGLNQAENMLDSRSTYLVGTVTDEAEDFATAQLRQRMEAILRLKAHRIDSIMGEMEGDVLILAEKMTAASKMTETNLPDRTPAMHDPRYEVVHSREMFYLPGPEGDIPSKLVQQAFTMEHTMENLTASYDVVPIYLYIGSKEGWSIRMDVLNNDKEQIRLPAEAMTASYDVRDRAWYKWGKQADAEKKVTYPVYTPLYTGLGSTYLVGCVMPYHDDKGFAGVVGMAVEPGVFFKKIAQQMQNDDEISFIINQQGQVIFSSSQFGSFMSNRPDIDLRQSDNQALAKVANAMAAGESGSGIIEENGQEYYLVYAPIGEQGWSMGELVELETIYNQSQNIGLVVGRDMEEIKEIIPSLFPRLRTTMAWSFGLLLVMLSLVSWYWAKKLSRPIKALTDGVERVAKGNFDDKLDIKTNDEIEELAGSFNVMTDELADYIRELRKLTEEKAKITAGLDVAAALQQGILPKDFPSNDRFSLYGVMKPAKEVGGDFYDYYFIDEHHLVLTIADVSDKGIPAAIFMVVAKTVLKNAILAHGEGDLAKAVQQANDQLAENNNEGLFVTVFVGVLDIRSGELIYVNAGHNTPLLCRSSGVSELPKMKAPMLGIMDGFKFTQNSIQLSSGDLLFMYTDGVTEAMDKGRQLFSLARLEQVLTELSGDVPPATVIDTVAKAVINHRQDADQSDDITVLAMHYF